MADPKEVDKVFRQIATWELANVPHTEIAKLMDVEPSRISQLIALPDYQKIKEEMAAATFEKDMRFNEAWDFTEERALGVIKKTLENSRDGDYALRVAAVANRARRRGVQSDRMIQSQQGMRAVVTLPMQFITKIETAKGEVSVSQSVVEGKPQQMIDVLKPAAVEKLFNPKEQKQKEDILEGVSFVT